MRKIFILTIPFLLFFNSIFSQNIDSLVHELTNHSITAMESGDAKSAVKYGKEALDLATESKVNTDSILGNIYSILGYAYLDNYQYETALNFFEQSLEKRICLYGEASSAVVKSYNSIGNYYQMIQFYGKAIQNYNKALEYSNQVPDVDEFLVGILYMNLSSAFQERGDFGKAILYAKKDLKNNLENKGFYNYDVAIDYANIGISYSAIKNYKKASEYYNSVIKITDSLHLASNHLLLINLYSNIGNQYLERFEFEAALTNYNKQLTKSISRYGKKHPYVATAYNDIASVYLKMLSEKFSPQTFNLALKNYSKALEITINQFGAFSPETKRIYSELGELYFKKGSLNTANQYLEKAKKSMIVSERKAEDEELLYAETYLNIYNLEARIQHELFSSTEDINDLHKADKAIQNTLHLMDKIKRNYKETVSKQLLLENNYSVFEKGIAINFQLWEEAKDSVYLYEAFRLSEKSKSNLLLDAFHKTKAEKMAGIPDSLLDLEQSLKNNITLYEKLVYQEEQQDEIDQQKINYANNRIFKLKNNYEKLILKFEAEYPAYYKLKYDIKILTVKEIQKQVISPTEGVLEYFVGDSSIYVFIIDKRDFLVFEIKNDFDLENVVKRFYNSVSSYNIFNRKSIDSLEMDYIETAHFLYQKIFEPFINNIPPRVIIIPDGVLAHVPFDALLSKKPLSKTSFRTHDYLLNEYMISYSYSAGLLLKQRDNEEIKYKGTLLAFAPVFRNNKLKLLMEEKSLNLKPLKYNIPEAQEIHKMTDGALFIGEEAIEQKFIEEAEHYKVLHLATHGTANDSLVEYSYLAFAEIPDAEENELLFLKDIYNLQLNADMVVLSACQTGVGGVLKGEGMISMSRAFSYAGADCIIPSLWNINDATTNELMQLFYKNIQDGKPKDVAMQKAKIAYIKNSFDIGAHPFYWSPFVIIGNNAPVQFPEKEKETNYRIPLMIIGLIGIIFWIGKKNGLFNFWPIKEA